MYNSKSSSQLGSSHRTDSLEKKKRPPPITITNKEAWFFLLKEVIPKENIKIKYSINNRDGKF